MSERGEVEAKTAGVTLIDNNFYPEICFTSYLKRSINTAARIVESYKKMNITFENVKKWELNERHYGALQGLDKIETAKKYGQEQVQIWRRSFDTSPPMAEQNSEHDPKTHELYNDIKSEPIAVKKKTGPKRKIPPSFRDMPGINTQEGLSRSLGKEDFYRKILIQFHGDYSDISDSLQKAVEMKQGKTILGMVHTIKGLAGSIGAAELSYAARDLETHIKSGKDSEIRTFLERFNTALMTVIESIETFVIPAVCPVPEADVKETGEQSILPALLLKLEPCVLNREPKPCLEIIDEIMKFSWPEENKKDLCELHEFIRGYQFKKAQSLMADMIENLKG